MRIAVAQVSIIIIIPLPAVAQVVPFPHTWGILYHTHRELRLGDAKGGPFFPLSNNVGEFLAGITSEYLAPANSTLSGLDLSNTRGLDAHDCHLLATLTNIKSLNLHGTRALGFGIITIFEPPPQTYSFFTSLTKLDLSLNQLNGLDNEMLALDTNTSLVSLNLAAGDLNWSALQWIFEEIRLNTTLTHLDLSMNQAPGDMWVFMLEGLLEENQTVRVPPCTIVRQWETGT